MRNRWLKDQIEYWSNLPSSAKPYQHRLQNDILESYIELDTVLELGWNQKATNAEYPFIAPIYTYLVRALHAVVHTDPIRLDANAVRLLAACNLAVLFNAMNMQLDLNDASNTVIPEAMRSLRYNAKWCINTLQDPQKN